MSLEQALDVLRDYAAVAASVRVPPIPPRPLLRYTRKHSPNVSARIARLNLDLMGKGAFICRWGRNEWLKVPRASVYKNGRRQYVTGLYIAQAGLR
jgi:hypothetical protein